MSPNEQYFVVAADGKEYGPADLETLRQWVREGRVVHGTHIKMAGGGVQYAGKMAELVDLFPPRDPHASAPGQAPPQQPLPSSVALPSEFRVWEFIGRGWNVMKPHWLVLSVMFLLQAIISGSLNFVLGVFVGALNLIHEPSVTNKILLRISCGMVEAIVVAPIIVGIWRAILGMIGGRKPDIGMMFQGFDRFGDAFLAYLAMFVLIVLGIFCFIVPGIILAIMWMFTYLVIAETSLGFWEAMRESSRLTEGYRWRLFLLVLAMIPLFLLGVLVCCVGVFVASAVNFTALALAYRFLQAKKGEASAVPA